MMLSQAQFEPTHSVACNVHDDQTSFSWVAPTSSTGWAVTSSGACAEAVTPLAKRRCMHGPKPPSRSMEVKVNVAADGPDAAAASIIMALLGSACAPYKDDHEVVMPDEADYSCPEPLEPCDCEAGSEAACGEGPCWPGSEYDGDATPEYEAAFAVYCGDMDSMMGRSWVSTRGSVEADESRGGPMLSALSPGDGDDEGEEDDKPVTPDEFEEAFVEKIRDDNRACPWSRESGCSCTFAEARVE